MREDKVSGLTCYTGRTSHSVGHQSSDTQHMYCTAHRPPQELEPPKQEEQFNSSKNLKKKNAINSSAVLLQY